MSLASKEKGEMLISGLSKKEHACLWNGQVPKDFLSEKYSHDDLSWHSDLFQ